MGLTTRYNSEKIADDLTRKMVFLGGPRQVGKTTLAEDLLENSSPQGVLFNWDDEQDRSVILSREFPVAVGMIVFDELHKYRLWRNYLKGIYDKRKRTLKILVTGSARLDFYRFGGDSLQGRYYYHRLHPLSVKELHLQTQEQLLALLNLSGFPEPYFSQSETEKKRWSNSYRSRIIRDDLRDLERVAELSSIELLAHRLPSLVGSPLSINSLREDLQVAHATIERWISILERIYYIYRVLPFGPPKVRAVKKLAKHYHFDWSLPEEPGIRFENFIAGHLLKWCHYQEDVFGNLLELRYYRDSEGREVDFVVVERSTPKLFVEVKSAAKDVSRGLIYLKSRYPSVRAVQVSLEPRSPSVTKDGIERLDALRFLSEFI